MAKNQVRRNRVRVAVMVGAASLMLVGATQAVGTTAAFTDAATATTGNFTGAANMLPTPEQSGVSCGNVYGYTYGGVSYNGAQVTFKHRGGPYNYVAILRDGGGNQLMIEDIKPAAGTAAGTGLSTRVYHANTNPPGTHGGWEWNVEIHTVNMAGQVSSAWVGNGIKANGTGWVINCNGGSKTGSNAVANRPASTNFAARGAAALDSDSGIITEDLRGDAERAGTPMVEGNAATDSSTAPTSGTTTPDAGPSAPESSTESSTPPATLTPDAPTTAPTTTAPPKPLLTNTQVAPSGTVTAGRTADGTAVVVDSRGAVLADGIVDPSATMQWEAGKDVLWIVGPDKVNRIMKSSDGTWKFYLDSGDNLPAGIGGN